MNYYGRKLLPAPKTRTREMKAPVQKIAPPVAKININRLPLIDFIYDLLKKSEEKYAGITDMFEHAEHFQLYVNPLYQSGIAITACPVSGSREVKELWASYNITRFVKICYIEELKNGELIYVFPIFEMGNNGYPVRYCYQDSYDFQGQAVYSMVTLPVLEIIHKKFYVGAQNKSDIHTYATQMEEDIRKKGYLDNRYLSGNSIEQWQARYVRRVSNPSPKNNTVQRHVPSGTKRYGKSL